ncbi:MAG TPA: DUF3987 domain-containing protein, partial [Agitococcus sp.]|nr:DUF3987 domain-containing protein [Agitococcus sp.]
AQFTFQTFDDVKGRQDKTLVRIYHGTFNEHKAKLAELNKRGGGVFVTINETDLRGRSLANMLKVRALFVDLDGSPLQPILDLPEDLHPHIIIESSPDKWHCYWLVNNCELEQFKPLQQALAAKFDGDKQVCDLPRVMRLAGFSHNKGESFITRIHTMQDNLYPYSVNKLIVGLGLNTNVSHRDIFPNNTFNTIDEEDFTIGLPPEADVIADLRSALEYLPCEDYHDWIRQAMHLKTLGNEGLDLWLAWSSKSAKFDRAEALNKWHSLQANRTDYKAIFNEAKAKGWINPLSNQSAAYELPDPLPITSSFAPVMPFSADLLPTALQEFVYDEADRMPAPVSFVAVSVLVALGSVIGASCGIKPKQKDDWLIVPNLWGGIVAPPTSKKTPAIDSGMRPLNFLINKARESYESDLKSHEKDKMLYKSKLEGLEADLKSASKTSSKNKPQKTREELAELICQERENEPMPPCLRRYKTNDCTVPKLGELECANPNGILVLRDELIGLLAGLDKEGKEEDRAFYLEGFNGTGSYDTDRIMRGSLFIKNHCLSVFGGIQPDKLIAYLEQAYSGLGNDGLLQRFQMLVYPDSIEWQYRDRYPNREAANVVFDIFKKLSETDFIEFGAYPTDEYNKRPYFRFSLDAQAFYVDWTHKLNTQTIPNEENTVIQQHLGKYERLLPALALIFHLIDCASIGQANGFGVSLEAIQRAARWCEYLETHARRVYGLIDGMGMRPALTLSKKIEALIKRTAKTDETPENWLKDGFTLRDVRRKQWQHLKDDNAIEKALTVLADNYWIVPNDTHNSKNGGRPTTRYFISQKLKTSIPPTAKTDETQKMNNFSEKTAQKIGFGSFGSTHLGDFENLENDSLILTKNELDDDFKTPIDPNDKKVSCSMCEH